jgi:hypothetical protein
VTSNAEVTWKSIGKFLLAVLGALAYVYGLLWLRGLGQ